MSTSKSGAATETMYRDVQFAVVAAAEGAKAGRDKQMVSGKRRIIAKAASVHLGQAPEGTDQIRSLVLMRAPNVRHRV